jgi:thymidylate synthase (FAD)
VAQPTGLFPQGLTAAKGTPLPCAMSAIETKPIDGKHAGSTSPTAAERVVRTPAESPLVDVMAGAQRLEIKIHEHGFVALMDAMPRLVPTGTTADMAIVQAARVSYGAGTKKVSEDRGLIRYLLRHRHTTPFEMVEFKFHVSMPIFIARQWIRHRTANVNEYSGRYSIMPDHFYRPTLEEVRKQSTTNKQGGEETFVSAGTEARGHEGARGDAALTAQEFLDYLAESEALYEKYKKLTEKGVSRELARIGLPVSVYTQWYWKCDLHNILRFLSLRMDAHAQKEIREYATAMYELMLPIVPITMEAWRDYELEAMHLTRLEIEAMRAAMAPGTHGPITLATDNKREQAEWDAKRGRLGL